MRRKAYGVLQRARRAFRCSNAEQRENLVRNLLERSTQRITLKSAPLVVQVEVTNRCNLNCVMCSRHQHPLELGDLSPDLFPKIVELSKRPRELVLFGYGEPLVSSAFYTLLERNRSGRVAFATNGVLLTQERIVDILARSARPVYNVTFSIDGADPATYASVRERSSYETVWENLAALAEWKAQHNLEFPEIWINFVAMKRNVRELPALIEKAADAGVSHITVFHLVVWDEAYVDESLVHDPDLTREVFAEAREYALRRGLRLDIPTEISENRHDNGAVGGDVRIPRCNQPWSYAYIRYDGVVQACCFSENLVMGDLTKKSFVEIWNDKPYRELRAKVNKTLLPDCRRCELRYRYSRSPDDVATYIKLKPRKK